MRKLSFIPVTLLAAVLYSGSAYGIGMAEYRAIRAQTTVTVPAAGTAIAQHFAGRGGEVLEIEGVVSGMVAGDTPGFLLQMDDGQTLVVAADKRLDRDVEVAQRLRVLARMPAHGAKLTSLAVTRLPEVATSDELVSVVEPATDAAILVELPAELSHDVAAEGAAEEVAFTEATAAVAPPIAQVDASTANLPMLDDDIAELASDLTTDEEGAISATENRLESATAKTPPAKTPPAKPVAAAKPAAKPTAKKETAKKPVLNPSPAGMPVPTQSDPNFSAAVQYYAKKIMEYNRKISNDVAWKISYGVLVKSPRYGVDPRLVFSLIAQESGFNPRAVSPAGAQGLGQLMPGTAAQLGIKNAFDIYSNIEGSVRYLAMQLERFNGNVSYALAAYNAGPGNVIRYGGIPPFRETQNYVQRVNMRYNNFTIRNL